MTSDAQPVRLPGDAQGEDGKARLEQVIADARERASTLRLEGHSSQAASIERVCDEVVEAAGDYLLMLSEAEAQLRSGWGVPKLRGLFPSLEAQGLAELRGRRRYYRACAIPRRANREAARLAGQRAVGT